MRRGRDSVPIVMEKDHGTSASIHTSRSWAVPGPLLFHASHKGMNGPQLAVGILGKSNTRLFRGYPVGMYPHRGRLSLCYS